MCNHYDIYQDYISKDFLSISKALDFIAGASISLISLVLPCLPLLITLALKAFSALSFNISCNCKALYGGNMISSSPNELFTLGSKLSMNVRLLLMPIILIWAFFSSEFNLVRVYMKLSDIFFTA